MRLQELYRQTESPIVTAHRGFSGRYPENTLLAFLKAVELGVDIVEFDVRESSDGALVVIHDALLDRTTNAMGPVVRKSLDELKRLNAGYWNGPHDRGERTAIPAYEVNIPTLEETLRVLAGKVGLNIQIYTERPESLEKIVRHYLDYDLRDSGFLMLGSFPQGELVRGLSPDVAICIGEERNQIDRHVAFGVDFIQPTRECLTTDYVRRLLESRIPANVFYANDPDDMLVMIEQGLPGIMTDVPDILINLIHAKRNGCDKG